MSNRTLRVNELIQRELSDILRKRYQNESMTITITEVRVAPDLRDARVFVSVMGSDDDRDQKLSWLRAHARAIRDELGRRIVLKFLPRFTFVADQSMEKGTRILQMLDEIDRQSPLPETSEEGEEPGQEPLREPPAS